MKRSLLALCLVALAVLTGCATTKPEVKIAAHLQSEVGRIELLTDPGECVDRVHKDNGSRIKGHVARVIPVDPQRVGATGCWWLTPGGTVIIENEEEEVIPFLFEDFTIGAPKPGAVVPKPGKPV